MSPPLRAIVLRLTGLAVLAGSLQAFGLVAFAKTSVDPRALLELAAKITGLNGSDVQPWRLKFTFKAFDEKGGVVDEGSYEEIWNSPIQFKRTLKGMTHTLTDYGTAEGVLRSGDEKKASVTLNDFHLAILNPMPAAGFIKLSDAREVDRDVSGVECHCIDLRQYKSQGVLREEPGFSYCFDMNNVLRRATMAAWNNTQYVLKNSVQFQGHTLPGDVEILNQGLVVETAHLESFGTIKDTDAAEFQPPADAVLHDKSNITLPFDVAESLLIKKVAPTYPDTALKAQIEGTVLLHGVIDKEGRLLNLRAVGGPPILQQAAIDAAKQWVYRPYTWNGVPVAMEINIMIPFSLGHR